MGAAPKDTGGLAGMNGPRPGRCAAGTVWHVRAPQGACGPHNRPQLRRIKIARLPSGANQIRCPAQPHQHTGQEGVTELLTRRPWIQLRIQG